MPRKSKTKSVRMSGKGIMSTLLNGLKAAHKIVKDKQLISKNLHMLGHPKAARLARQFGYGRRQRGGESLGDLKLKMQRRGITTPFSGFY